MTLVPGGLAVADYGGAPGQRDQGTLRLIAGVGNGAASATGSMQPAASRLLAAGLDGPTGVARLPDGRWALVESGHTRLRVLTGDRS